MATNKNQEREAREARNRLKQYNARQTVHTTQIRRRKRDNVIAIAAVLVVAAAATFLQVSYFTSGPGAPVPSPTATAPAAESVGSVPSPALSENRTWTGSLSLNDVDLAIELDGAAAPQGVASFISDIKNGYLVGKTCHRLVDSPGSAQLIQCGSIDGAGGSDPDYSFGPVENAAADDLYTTGTIALARQEDNGNSQGHQFFITFGDSTFPSDSAGGYTVIGKVTAGIPDLVSKIASGGATTQADKSTPPNIATTITAATIE
ncbi:peptidylprolyl isomerase [Glaciihabitans arcticus]|uniref:peptidylprolyl isomerase n=1 Tax=Glaciihabitans arcticus TaxID=2668039 RepID=UPI001F022A1D|nr:peptidylprolyl isomerase [Glaciihabitans arcticus]